MAQTFLYGLGEAISEIFETLLVPQNGLIKLFFGLSVKTDRITHLDLISCFA